MAGTREQLHAPWRMEYIRSLEKDPVGRDPLADRFAGCFLCAAANIDVAVAELGEERSAAMRRRLVIRISDHCVSVINRFPYTSGHVMVAPRRHVAELEHLTADEAMDLHSETVRVIQLLRDVMNPQGFNVGINLGTAAGAGIPGHLHRHIVPRWAGDTNFMSVVGDVRVVPQMPETLWDILQERLGRG
ncbi:MAG: HIT domain-containing protein [Planctomycetota bacterium]